MPRVNDNSSIHIVLDDARVRRLEEAPNRTKHEMYLVMQRYINYFFPYHHISTEI